MTTLELKEFIMEKDKILKMFPRMSKWVKDMLEDRYSQGVTDKDVGNGFRITNDPVKMLGCGATVSSSYSPDSPSFDFLPSFVFQPYVSMVYKPSGNTVKFEHNGVELECPEYNTRCFVLMNEECVKCLPSYGKPGVKGFKVSAEPQTFVVHSPTRPPEIHLDGVDLYYDGDAHYAVCGCYARPKDYDCVVKWMYSKRSKHDN